jgi:uncharacterized repeat protein (TIGR02543 family)
LVANFALKTYSVTFDANGGTGNMPPQIFTHGVAQALDANTFTNVGKYFNGWAMSTAGHAVYSDETEFSTTKNVTLHAVWEDHPPVIYTITLSASPSYGGSVFGYGEHNENMEIIVKARPNTGYDFVNWMEADTVVTTDTAYMFTVAENRTLIAHFALKTYSVTFEANEGTGGMAPQIFTHGVPQKLNANSFTKIGDSFIGWATTAIADAVLSDTAMFIATSDTTLYAVWKPIVHTLELSANPSDGGVVLGAGDYNKFAEITVKARPNEGYEFVNWTTNKEPLSLDTAYVFTITGNLSLVANFALKTYSVTFDANGGTGNMPPQMFTHGVAQVLSTNTFTRAGKYFNGWATSIDGNAVYSDEAEFSTTENVTLYAVWEDHPPVIYTITLSANPSHGGMVFGAGEHNEGSVITKKATPNIGYEFVNWTENDTVITTDTAYTFTVVGNRTFVANFTPVASSVRLTDDMPEVKIYPNPIVDGKLTIEIPENTNNNIIQIYDFSGKLVLTRTAGQPQTEIDIQHFSNGTYIVKIGNVSAKIVKR